MLWMFSGHYSISYTTEPRSQITQFNIYIYLARTFLAVYILTEASYTLAKLQESMLDVDGPSTVFLSTRFLLLQIVSV